MKNICTLYIIIVDEVREARRRVFTGIHSSARLLSAPLVASSMEPHVVLLPAAPQRLWLHLEAALYVQCVR